MVSPDTSIMWVWGGWHNWSLKRGVNLQAATITLDSKGSFVARESESHSVVSNSLWPPGLYSPWNSPHQNTGVGNFSLLQGIFPTQGSNPGLPHCRRIFYQLSHQGNPRILERVAYPFSSRSSWPRNLTGVSCIAGGFFTNWAMKDLSSYQKGQP